MEKVEELLKALRNEFIEGFIGRESLDKCEKGLLAKIADVERHMDMYKEDLGVVQSNISQCCWDISEIKSMAVACNDNVDEMNSKLRKFEDEIHSHSFEQDIA